MTLEGLEWAATIRVCQEALTAERSNMGAWGLLTVGWHWQTLWPGHCQSLLQPTTKLGRQHQHTPEESKHSHCQMRSKAQGVGTSMAIATVGYKTAVPCLWDLWTNWWKARLLCSQISHYLHVLPWMRKTPGGYLLQWHGSKSATRHYSLVTRKDPPRQLYYLPLSSSTMGETQALGLPCPVTS